MCKSTNFRQKYGPKLSNICYVVSFKYFEQSIKLEVDSCFAYMCLVDRSNLCTGVVAWCLIGALGGNKVVAG